MGKEKIILYSSNKVEISESQDNSYMNVKFIICNFDTNKNNVMLNKDTIETWINTLLMKPLVGLIKPNRDDELDFTSHQAKKVYELINGQLQEKLKFGTDAFGVFDSVQIETIDNIEYITANCRVWKRFENCCKIIQTRFDKGESLNTSWEISIINSEIKPINGKQVKVINEGVFIGHALLSKYVSPAYNCSGMLEVAEEQENEFVQAFINDLTEINKLETQIIQEKNIEISIQSDENSVDNKLNENIEGGHKIMVEGIKKVEISSLTMDDLYNKLSKAIRVARAGENKWYYITRLYPVDFKVIAHSYEDEDDKFVEFIYNVNEDGIVSITSQKEVEMVFIPKEQNDTNMAELQTKVAEINASLSTKTTELSEKINEIVTLGESIISLKGSISEKEAIIAELEPLRIEKAEAETKKLDEEKTEKKKCLSEMLVSSKYFTQEEIQASDEIQEAIAELAEDKLKGILANKVIAEAQKITESTKEKEVEKEENTTKDKKKAVSEVEVSTDLNANKSYDYQGSSNALLNYARRNIK